MWVRELPIKAIVQSAFSFCRKNNCEISKSAAAFVEALEQGLMSSII
jgi:hypothetical protein